MTIAAADQITMYRNMVLIRRFEEGVAEAYADGFIGGFTHLYIGQEAVATGSITALNHDDYAIGTYRVHAHALVRGSIAALADGRAVRPLDGRVQGQGRLDALLRRAALLPGRLRHRRREPADRRRRRALDADAEPRLAW